MKIKQGRYEDKGKEVRFCSWCGRFENTYKCNRWTLKRIVMTLTRKYRDMVVEVGDIWNMD